MIFFYDDTGDVLCWLVSAVLYAKGLQNQPLYPFDQLRMHRGRLLHPRRAAFAVRYQLNFKYVDFRLVLGFKVNQF
jgi:hypothetical protein